MEETAADSSQSFAWAPVMQSLVALVARRMASPAGPAAASPVAGMIRGTVTRSGDCQADLAVKTGRYWLTHPNSWEVKQPEF